MHGTKMPQIQQPMYPLSLVSCNFNLSNDSGLGLGCKKTHIEMELSFTLVHKISSTVCNTMGAVMKCAVAALSPH